MTIFPNIARHYGNYYVKASVSVFNRVPGKTRFLNILTKAEEL